jgi:hypothetical protein
MMPVVVERSLAPAASAQGRPIVIVPRARRRGRWSAIEADAAVDAIDRAGPEAIVLARPAAADTGAARLMEVARLLAVPVVRLPAEEAAAAWVIATATHRQFEGEALVRRLQVLVGVAAGRARLPSRPVDAGPAMPALRPGVLARWAGCVWRPCALCPGGGLTGAACGRCGSPLRVAA